MATSLFQKYGGFATVSRVVLSFYEKALDSDQIGGFFEDIDMKKLVDHQTKFVSTLLGGPASYTDHQIGQMHRNLEVTNEDFDEVGRLLAETLDEFGFEPGDRDAVLSEIEARREVVVKA